jgi:hypothetical protein
LTRENLQRFYNEQETHLVEYKRVKDEQEREEQFELEKRLASLNASNRQLNSRSSDHRLSKVSKKVELSDTDRSSKTEEKEIVKSIRPKTGKRPRKILTDALVQVEQQDESYNVSLGKKFIKKFNV